MLHPFAVWCIFSSRNFPESNGDPATRDFPISVYIDDILITGETETDHLQTLEQVLEQLAKAGLCVKKNKCKFMVPSLDYLGYIIDAHGLRPHPDKVMAIQQAPI